VSTVAHEPRAALRACWHPVAYASAVATAHRTTLLGEPLVLRRDGHGALQAAGHDGARHSTTERYGIAWVALQSPRWPIPEVPELDDATWRTVRTGPFAWACDASRQVENFTDFGHFAFVHAGLLGDPDNAVVAPHQVAIDGHVLRYAYGRPDVANTDAFPVFAAEERKDSLRRTRYALHLPFTIVEHIDWGGADRLVYFFASQPVADDRCVGYCLIARNYNLDQPDEVIQAFERTIFAQDQRVVESQRPDRVPFDLAAELHLAFDAVAVAYRRAMRAHGLG
jgi:vanillate O-demethylase monooxygenase subunit